MKKLIAPSMIGAWIAGLLPDRLYFLGRKTPWYRRSMQLYWPWITGALVAPLGVFVAWKGFSLLRSRNQTGS